MNANINNFILLKGNGNNGKTFLTQKIIEVFEEISIVCDNLNLEIKENVYRNPFLLKLNNKKILIINELNKNMDTKFMKTLTGKDIISCRKNHSNTIEHIRFDGGVIACTNHDILFDYINFAVARRIFIFNLTANFNNDDIISEFKNENYDSEEFKRIFQNYLINMIFTKENFYYSEFFETIIVKDQFIDSFLNIFRESVDLISEKIIRKTSIRTIFQFYKEKGEQKEITYKEMEKRLLEKFNNVKVIRKRLNGSENPQFVYFNLEIIDLDIINKMSVDNILIDEFPEMDQNLENIEEENSEKDSY